MRDVPTERLIERRLVSRFDVDTSRVDVTVMNREATIAGVLVRRTQQKPFRDTEAKEVVRYFSVGRFPGVDRFYFNLRSARIW